MQAYSFIKDGLYQNAIISDFYQNKIISNNENFLIGNNYDANFFANRRWLNNYEWSGMLRVAYPEATKQMVLTKSEFSLDSKSLSANPQYNMKNNVYAEPVIVCIKSRYISFDDILSYYAKGSLSNFAYFNESVNPNHSLPCEAT